MAAMSRHSSTTAYQGFSVFQPALGTALQWLPAVGTQELDDMVNAFLPGPASIQDKRAHISMDFFEYSRMTGETFKFYAAPTPASFSSATAASPASSSALYDSGYGSSFNTSPVVSDMSPWTQSPIAYEPKVGSPSSISKKPSASTSRQQTAADFSSHPGMRIMTKDGRDVTNSASRGCKTKEQRDHAHLMRIIKACDACKKKKIRCDPSHKKRNASHASPAQAESKVTKKSKKAAAAIAAPPPPIAFNDFNDFNFDLTATDAFETPETAVPFAPYDESYDSNIDDLWWNQFVQSEPATLASNNFVLQNYDFDSYLDPQSSISHSSGSSATSPSQVFTPLTPAQDGLPLAQQSSGDAPATFSSDAALPYLNPRIPHGTDYVDFNLYSPGSDFSLDEELHSLNRSNFVPQGHRRSSPQGDDASNSHQLLHQFITDAAAVTPTSQALSSSSPQDVAHYWGAGHESGADSPHASSQLARGSLGLGESSLFQASSSVADQQHYVRYSSELLETGGAGDGGNLHLGSQLQPDKMHRHAANRTRSSEGLGPIQPSSSSLVSPVDTATNASGLSSSLRAPTTPTTQVGLAGMSKSSVSRGQSSRPGLEQYVEYSSRNRTNQAKVSSPTTAISSTSALTPVISTGGFAAVKHGGRFSGEMLRHKLKCSIKTVLTDGLPRRLAVGDRRAPVVSSTILTTTPTSTTTTTPTPQTTSPMRHSPVRGAGKNLQTTSTTVLSSSIAHFSQFVVLGLVSCLLASVIMFCRSRYLGGFAPETILANNTLAIITSILFAFASSALEPSGIVSMPSSWAKLVASKPSQHITLMPTGSNNTIDNVKSKIQTSFSRMVEGSKSVTAVPLPRLAIMSS
ncbi:hypothetical protein B0T17DRAFT_511567 [Bombardia bombarda]|uniref:Uncharacterized protein n=1 Tax=Bombardia bombarda TaxID=252184 RepID=A0AA39TI78_9PEZI|nr:hypothetical protein B0T17DRAFT_511567 [Bombardia bombarda]